MVKIKVIIEMNWMMKMYVCSCYGHHSQSFTLFITCLDIINQSNDRNMLIDIQCHSHSTLMSCVRIRIVIFNDRMK